MKSQTHIAIGMTAALLVVQPRSFADIACTMAGGMIGGAMPDIDVNNHNGYEDNIKDQFMPDYPDIIPVHPDWSDEDYESFIGAEMEKVKDMKEWPDI